MMKLDSPEVVKKKFNALKKAFYSGKTRDIEWRKQQLRNLKEGIIKETEAITDAEYKDLKREKFFAEMVEVFVLSQDIDHAIAHVDEWAKPLKKDTPLLLAPAKSRIVYQPLGAVCSIGAWNGPFLTTFFPVVSAIAAGNTCLIKPSELSPASSAVIRMIVEKYLDSECFMAVEGGVDVSIAITQLKWDLIAFTGGSEKGKLIAQAAAKHLTPCLLELGGKCPAIIDESADIDFVAAKILGGRYVAGGQGCICPEYALIHESKKDEFIDLLIKRIREAYGDNPLENEHYSRIINEAHTQRILNLLKDHGGKVHLGGTGDLKERYIAPTIIENPNEDSNLMKDEIFGPIFSVFSFKDIEEVYQHLNEREKPLAMYYFGKVNNNPVKDTLEKYHQAGTMVVNDTCLQFLNPDMGFGGIGYSGIGKYHGKEGFVTFSNSKSVIVKPTINIESANKMILPPYSESEKKQIRQIFGLGLYQSHIQKYILIVLAVFILLLLYKMGFIL